jgi:hypothetical protein
MFLGFYLIALDTRPDLSDAEPRYDHATYEAIPLGWPSLRQAGDFSEPNPVEAAIPNNGSVVKMLGYMMDGYRFVQDGAPVTMFILMPGAGHFLHPAHRNPDEMVEVWLKSQVLFKSRELVRVEGTFERLPSRHAEGHSLYALRNAAAAPATKAEIRNWSGR